MTIGEKTLRVGGSRPDLITNITIVGLDSYTLCKVFVTCLATTLELGFSPHHAHIHTHTALANTISKVTLAANP